MLIFPDDRCEWRPTSCTDFVTWWLPEFTAAAGCVLAGLVLSGPLALLAVPALLRPTAHLVHLPALRRQRAERLRARLAAAEEAECERIAAAEAIAEPVTARSERLDRPRPQLGGVR